MLTRTIIKDLFDYLEKGDYYSRVTDSSDNEELNKTIGDKWATKIEDGLKADFGKILPGKIHVEQKKLRFEIVDNDAQGATTWKSFVRLTDRNETMDVVISFIVNHDNAFIYLGASHSNVDTYPGTSEVLKQFFNELKKSEKVGHFFQTKFYDFVR